MVATGAKVNSSLIQDESVFQVRNNKKMFWNPGDLVRQCGSMETLTAVGGIYGNLTTVQAIWLKSKLPIEIDHVEKVLEILTKQVSVLQFCLAKRGMHLWFKRIEHQSMDFDASNDDVMEVYEELVASNFDMWNGPLWRARLVFTNANEVSADQESYGAVLIFAVHHCITDGTTNMMLCRETVRLLNELSKGNTIAPKSIPISPIIDDHNIESPSFHFAAKYATKKLSSTLFQNYSRKTSFDGSFPVPKIKNPETKVLFSQLTATETRNLIKQCKGEGVTVHSCITTASNFALLKTAQTHHESSLGKSSIKVTHCVNVRRYFDEQNKDAAGCHISIMESKSKMNLIDHKHFWEHAKDVHSTFKKMLEQKHDPARLIPLMQYASLIMPTNKYLTSKGYKNKIDCHYMTTNMGNLKALLPDPSADDIIEIADLRRSVSMKYMSNPFLLTFHTFKDSFHISMDYYTNKMETQIAKEYFNTLCQFLRNLSDHGALH